MKNTKCRRGFPTPIIKTAESIVIASLLFRVILNGAKRNEESLFVIARIRRLDKSNPYSEANIVFKRKP